MKIGIFGYGYIYLRYKSLIPKGDEITAIIDNDITMHGSETDGVRRIYPREYRTIPMDIIVLMSDAASEMRDQLIRCGCPKERIVHYRDYFGGAVCGRVTYAGVCECRKEKRLLVISNELGYHGGSIVAMRTAKCAQELGYDVTIAAASGQEKFVSELNRCGITVVLQTWLRHASWNSLQWVNDFDAVIVNTFPMIKCAIEISKHREVMMWLHESAVSYYELEYWQDYIRDGLKNKRLKLYAVTRRACENLYRFYGDDIKAEVLPVAIEDWKEKSLFHKTNPCLVYAVIGNISRIKGQDMFLSTLKAVQNRGDNYYLLVGKAVKDEYCEYIKNESFYENNVILLGERTQEEIRQLFSYIDVVVVPSREESFSMAAAEAMMMGKVCIVSDNCGISDYLRDGENGFIFKTGSIDSLRRILSWCDEHKEELHEIGENARKTYEENFTAAIHKRRLEEVLKKLR